MDSISALFASLDPTLLPLGAIVTFVVISLVRGWLIPRRIYLDRMADKDQQIKSLATERDNWRIAYQDSVAANRELTTQNTNLIDGQETANRLLESLRNHLERTNPNPPQEPPTPRTPIGS